MAHQLHCWNEQGCTSELGVSKAKPGSPHGQESGHVAQSCNWWPLSVLQQIGIAWQGEKQFLKCYSLMASVLSDIGHFRLFLDSMIWTAVIQCATWPFVTWDQQSLEVKWRKKQRRVNCFSPALKYQCPLQMHFATARTWKRGLCSNSCSTVLDFKIYFRWKKYKESSIQCILSSSCVLEQVLDSVRKKKPENLSSILINLARKCICKIMCQINPLSAVLPV